jgi:transcriptional regulator with XRE-family HTH domain
LAISESAVLRRIGKRVVSLRNERGWTQERLSEAAAMQRSYVADLERGSRNLSVRTLVKIANAFGIPVRDLFQD